MLIHHLINNASLAKKVLGCGLLIAVTACGVQQQATAHSVKSSDSHAHPHQKTGANVRFVDPNPRTLEPLAVQAVDLSLSHEYTDGQAIITLSVSEGLQLISDTEQVLSLDKRPLPLVVEVIPNNEGRHYITATIQLENTSQANFSRTMGVAIQVGEKTSNSTQQKATDANGEPLKSMPAQERIY